MIVSLRMRLAILLLFFLPHVSNQQRSFESTIQLTAFGTQFQPRSAIEQLATFASIRSILRCAMQCNQNRQCRTFDYDSSSLDCRLFEGDISTGTVLNHSIPSSSRIGSIRLSTPDALEQYASHNQTCDRCGLGVNRYLQCTSDRCQCPVHTYWNGQICSNQLYNGSACNSSSECRQDLNLTCSSTTKTCTLDTPGGIVLPFSSMNSAL